MSAVRPTERASTITVAGSSAVPWRGQPVAWTRYCSPGRRSPQSTYPWPVRSINGSTQATSHRYPSPGLLTTKASTWVSPISGTVRYTIHSTLSKATTRA
jgi:hypothetical protein